jgi:hypothetical protein
MGALINFLGGAAFRAIWNDVGGYFKAKQEQKNELARMELQGRLDAEAHARLMDSAKQQAELGFKTIEVQSQSAVDQITADAWRQAVATATKPSGVAWVDAWSSMVRPAIATVALAMWAWYEFQHMAANAWIISSWSLDMIGSVVGFWYADRTLRRAK